MKAPGMKVMAHELASTANASAQDALSPYKEALREHFPTREALLQEAKQQTKRQRVLKKVGSGMAMSLALALSWVIDPVWHSENMRTKVGQQASFTLTDGSHVALNTNSALVVEQHLYSRRLYLKQGEALFTAEHGWRPFTVYANQTQIRDIGTIFNVRNTDQGAVVTVVEGSVEVRTPQARRILTRDVSVTTQAGGITESRCSSANIAWQQGRLMFDGHALASVVDELQRYRHGRIQIADRLAAQYRLSGEFDISGIDTLLDTLPDIMPVSITKKDDGTVLISHR
ncbi:FecR family protein [Methylophilus aquaticus]|uniref:FecR domain-containing protein n=1 Tax=Methylophilus aquaticus TaxID=1971610 RepID=A0ABT9JUY3_9PROT|nr:FecR domain-containing protein [Methylophilus aquaticus]MDP8568343.1 FecR domain-containing protein [Methylophilus aquaticus]